MEGSATGKRPGYPRDAGPGNRPLECRPRLIARASAIIDSLGVMPAYGGESLTQQTGLFQQVADEFGG